MIQTAEGALNETHSILQRQREIANQSANGTNTDSDRQALQDEMNQLTSEINRIGNTTEFNTQKLLNGGIGSNGSDKLTQATSAQKTASVANAGNAVALTGATITVDNRTFDLSSITVGSVGASAAANAKALKTALDEVTSGGVKLSELVDIKVGANDALEFTAKSTGSTSKLDFAGAAALGVGATATATGDPSTIERAGLEGGNALTAADVSIAAGATLKFTVGSESEVTVNLNSGVDPKTYDTNNTDANVAKAAMDSLIKDLNASLQSAGLDSKITASLSKDNKIQFISETGKDIKLGASPAAGMGLSNAATIGNIDQVVGAGAQGVGFSTKFQIGANTGQSMSLQINDVRAAALGITGNAGQAGFTKDNAVTNGSNDIKGEAALNISTREDASKAIAVLDKATSLVSSERAKLGAVQNRLEHTINNLGTASENLTAAESRIRDVDMAKEMMSQTKNNILAQAAQAMLAQANQAPQGVLQLLR